MDIPRPTAGRSKTVRRLLITSAVIVVLAVITFGLSRLEPAAPSVERATLWIDTVRRGDITRQVRGSGTLVPEQVQWIPAGTDGRVERILLEPGTQVTADSAVLELSNPELEQAAQNAEAEVAGAVAELANLKVQLQSQQLTQESTAASAQASYATAKLRAEANEQLAAEGLIAPLTLKESQVAAEELAIRNEIEKKRVAIAGQAAEAQLAVQEARLGQLRGAARLRRQQVEALRVRAGIAGVLQQVPVEVGQRVTQGQTLAKIAEPGRLKAEIRVAETQVRDVQIGQSVSVDTRNGLATGTVSRIDPAVVNGMVQVDVSFKEPLPRGARPDLTVDGTIELEKLLNIVYVGRPALGQEQSTVSLYRIAGDTGNAQRVPVTLGRSSVANIEVVAGLEPGDQVILSDMSAWDAFDRIRLR